VKKIAIPKSHHLDKRADLITASPGNDEEMIDTRELANWLRVSIQWLEIGRMRGYGPAFIKIAPRCIRYRKDAVRTWLEERAHASTAEYARRRKSA
jgi:hypothetical protein